MFCVSFLVILAEPEREYLADELVRERDEVVQRGVRRADLAAVGEEHLETMIEACNHASLLKQLNRFNEIKALLVGTIPVARRVLGVTHAYALRMRCAYAQALYLDASATLDDLREALNTIEEIEPTARRVFGGAHPLTSAIEQYLQNARAALTAREPKK